MKSPWKKRIVLCVAALLLTGCGESAQTTLDKFLAAKFQSQYEQVYQLHSSQDQAAKSEQEFMAENSQTGLAAMAQIVASQTKYHVLKVEEQGDRATAQVEFDMPDYSKLMGDMMSDLFKTAFSSQGKSKEENERELAEKMSEKFKSAKDLPRIKRTESVQLVKEAGQWKVFENWEQKKRLKALQDEAKAFEEKKDLKAAKASYDEILKLSPDDKNAREKADTLGKKLEVQAARDAYRPKLELTGVKVETSEGYFERTYVSGKLKNKGTRSLMEVEVTVYYLDAKGQPIFEETHYPVITTDPDDQDELLKPGYIDEFSFSAEKAPSDWKGKVKVEISNLKFNDEPKIVESFF